MRLCLRECVDAPNRRSAAESTCLRVIAERDKYAVNGSEMAVQ